MNGLVFLGQLSDRALWVPLVVAVPVLVFHLLLRRPFPVGWSLAVASLAVLGRTALRVRRLRYSEDDVRAYVDSWLGGRGEILVGAAPTTGEPVLPALNWSRALRAWFPAVCALAFVWHVPVLARPPLPQLAAHSTRDLGGKIEALGELGLLSEERREELEEALEQFEADARNMSTEEFWHASDRVEMQVEQALAESRSAFESAAAELQKLAGASTTMAGAEAGAAAEPGALTEALARILQSLPGIPPALAAAPGGASNPLRQMMDMARAGNLEALQQALDGLSEAERAELARQLAEQMAAQGAACNSASPGMEAGEGTPGGGTPGRLEDALVQTMQASGFREVFLEDGRGRGGVSRGPGTNPYLFGSESPDVRQAMENALLPSSGAQDPGQLLERTRLPAAPQVDRTGWGRAGGGAGLAEGAADEGGATAVIAPRHRRAVGRYFEDEAKPKP